MHDDISVFLDLLPVLQCWGLEIPTGAISQKENTGIMSLLDNPQLKWNLHQQVCDFSCGLLIPAPQLNIFTFILPLLSFDYVKQFRNIFCSYNLIAAASCNMLHTFDEEQVFGFFFGDFHVPISRDFFTICPAADFAESIEFYIGTDTSGTSMKSIGTEAPG